MIGKRSSKETIEPILREGRLRRGRKRFIEEGDLCSFPRPVYQEKKSSTELCG